jgi:hypothetical protein
MKIDRRITGGLAWAGLVVILAVPSADILFGKPEVRASITSDMSAVPPDAAGGTAAPASGPVDTVETASISEKPVAATPASVPAAGTSSTSAAAPAKPAPVPTGAQQAASAPPQGPAPVDGTAPATEVATAAAAVVDPPIPMPRNMRPLPATVIPPQQPVNVATTNEAAPAEAPLIIDEKRVPPQRQATNRGSSEFFGPSGRGPVVTEDKLAAWNSGSLSDYLQRNGLIDEGAPSEQRFDDNYDPDGFFLSDGPERPRRNYPRPREDGWFF